MELTWSSFMARSRNWLAAAMTKTLWPTHCTNYAIRKQHDSQPILRSFTRTLKESPYTMKAICLHCFAHLRQNGQVYRDWTKGFPFTQPLHRQVKQHASLDTVYKCASPEEGMPLYADIHKKAKKKHQWRVSIHDHIELHGPRLTSLLNRSPVPARSAAPVTM